MLKRHGFSTLLVMVSLLLPVQAVQSAELDENLIRRVEAMERNLEALKRELEGAKRQAAAAKKQAEAAGKKAAAEDDSLSKWHLAGYTSADFTATDAGTVDTTFGALKFNPVIHYQYSDLILFEGELEFELEDDGSTKTSLEYASLDFFAHDYLTVVAGQFLSPLGQFQERLHPSWINKLPDRPAGFAGSGGMLPLSELGIMLRGGIPLNSMTLNYSIYVGNGPQVELSSGELEKLELEAFGGDDNDDKAIGGRIGILPVPYVEIGASFLTSQVRGKKDDVAGAVSEGDFTLWAVDAAYTRGAADLRFEYMSSELDSFLSQTEANTATTLVPKTEWDAWYVQAAYRLSGFTDTAFLKNLELVARYGDFDVKGFANFVTEGDPEERWTIGINYLFAPSVSLKTALSWRDKTRDGAEDSTEFKAQLSYGF